MLVPSVPGSTARETDGPLTVTRFRYFPRRWEDLADGAILENLRSRKSRWLQVLPFFLFETIAIWRAVRRTKPDVMHVHWLIPQGLAAVLAAPRVPKLVTTLGGDLYGLRDPISRRIIRRVLGNARAATAMNADMRDQLVELGSDPAHTHVLPMGADVSAIRPLAAEAVRSDNRVLFVGRLVEKKGLIHLIEAVRGIDDSKVELRVVGDGPLRTELEAAASGLNVTFLGALGRQQLAAEYGSAAVAAFPSVLAASGDQDGLPVALLEAMSTGAPVVVSDLPGLAEAVVDGVSGRVVQPGSASELAASIRELLANADLRERLGSGASHRADEYSVESIGRRYVALLDEIVHIA